MDESLANCIGLSSASDPISLSSNLTVSDCYRILRINFVFIVLILMGVAVIIVKKETLKKR